MENNVSAHSNWPDYRSCASLLDRNRSLDRFRSVFCELSPERIRYHRLGLAVLVAVLPIERVDRRDGQQSYFD
jgi:hypothetical protein